MGNLREAALSPRLRLALVTPWLALLAAGCVTTEGGLWPWSGAESCEKPCQPVCIWQNNVLTVPDSANGGVPVQGFAGRVYLFGTNMDFPLLCDGTLTVDLIDESCDPPKWVERWNIDPETLQRLKKKDVMGWGYTVFLPSKEYRPEMTKIKLKTAFQAPKSPPIFTENAVTLAATNGVIREGTTPLTRKQLPLPPVNAPHFQPPIPLR
ncbi:MAG: hypothetical protein U0797_20305 [Gemmataceae bacterium]